MPSKENIFETMVEKYRFWIGGILILAIVGGSAVLIWRENYKMPSLDGRIKNLESRISQLEDDQKISKSELQISNQNSNEQMPNVQTEQAQPAVSNNSTTVKPISGKININSATATELDTLTGIGPAYAQRIIDYRNTNGGFKSIDELDNVKGIGKTTIDKFRDQVTI